MGHIQAILLDTELLADPRPQPSFSSIKFLLKTPRTELSMSLGRMNGLGIDLVING